MLNLSIFCWGGWFFEAYKYCSNYLILTLTIIIGSILFVWIYENPGLYQLIFKKSKHSSLHGSQSEVVLDKKTINTLDHKDFTETEVCQKCYDVSSICFSL